MSVRQISDKRYLVATSSRDQSIGLHILEGDKLKTLCMIKQAHRSNVLLTIEWIDNALDSIGLIDISPDGSLLASGSVDSFINIYEISTECLQ